ncbi:WhiB family transcriptional regulator, redox-sensing transcriptional regulator [Micromonospora rhizosphaerae]|uniref:Transcriptional regulator WhiB n=1 Tax=Micromonospora rhizosphaerae TaxID=568872 RepID=A0A1C6SMK7_9ACTN|nr:WhiB family transcriptional regulator, redox-sensing transcriptional regulator [Micromonospora rhizosphaerae]
MTVSLLSGRVARSSAPGKAAQVGARTRSPQSGRLTWADVDYRTLLGAREDWWDRAACRGIDVDVFYPLPNDGAAAERALRVCGRCPIRAKCRQYAVSNREAYGIWGGMTERQRAALVRRRFADSQRR